MNGYIVDNVACGGCHTLLTATKGSNSDFTNNDFSLLTEQSKQTNLLELPPLQKVPGTIMNKGEELSYNIEDITNSNIETTLNPDTINGNPVNCEDTTSIDSLEANVSGSHIVHINDLENENGSIHEVPELNKDEDEKKDNDHSIDIKTLSEAIDNIPDITNQIKTTITSNVETFGSNVIHKIEQTTEQVANDVKPNIEIFENFVKKTETLDPGHNCDHNKSLGIPDKATEIQNSPPPKSPLLEELLQVPDIAHLSPPDVIRHNDDGQKSESGSKSENETIPCESDKSSPQAGKISKTQAVLPIVRSEEIIDTTEHNTQSDETEVVVQKLADKGRFARIFQSIRDKENSCMGKGKVIEDTVVGK